MANRYWVGGTATWDNTAGTKWSTTSGGAGGSAVPTASDDVFFNAASGAVTCTISGSRVCLSLNCTGFTGTLTGTSSPVLTISGNLTFATGMTVGTMDLIFNSTISRTITSAGKAARSYTFSGTGGTWALQDALNNSGGAFSSNYVQLTRGTLNLNNFALKTNRFLSDNTNTRTIAFGTGSIEVTSGTGANTVWNAPDISNLTVTGTPAVITSSSSLVTFAVNFYHGSDAGGAEAKAINVTSTSNLADIDLTLAGSFKNINLSTANSSANLVASVRTIYGNLTLSASMVINSTGSVTFLSATSGTQDITSNGATVDFPITQNGVGGTVRLLGNLTMGFDRIYTLNFGVFNANNYNMTAGRFNSNNSNTRTITMGSGTWTLSGIDAATLMWNISTTTGLTFNKDTANITLTGAAGTTSPRTFAGGDLTYNNLSIGGATGVSTLTFTGSNTFGTISSTKTVAHTILFTSGTTTTVADWTVTGSVGKVLTIGSVTAGVQHTLTKTGGGTITVDYASISDSNATPVDTWYATNSIDGGNNTGWFITAPGTGNFLMLF